MIAGSMGVVWSKLWETSQLSLFPPIGEYADMRIKDAALYGPGAAYTVAGPVITPKAQPDTRCSVR